LTLRKEVLFGYFSVPCVSGIGSCKYDDLCSTCSQCGCPLKAVSIKKKSIFQIIEYIFQGDHVLTLPITIDTSSWALVGNYEAQVHVQTNSGQKGCVKVSNVHIQSSK